MRVLLVEDDEDLALPLRADLERAGYAIDIAADGRQAAYLGDEGIYDLVVLDLGLPQRSGLDVLAGWRRAQNRVPVIILTARDTWQERVDGLKAGADDYVGKPFHTEELLARMQAVLHRSASQQPGLLRGAGLTLNEDTQTVVTKNGEEHPLTGTEFRLLRYFMLHPGVVLSKSRLTDAVYDFDSDKDSNVIEVYVKRLRAAIGSAPIINRRGQGYVFRQDD